MNKIEEYDMHQEVWSRYRKTVPFLLAFWLVCMYIAVSYG